MMGTKQFDNYADLITFTRASGGTALRPISYGSELVTNGTFDTDLSGWTGSGWAWQDGKAYDSGASVTDDLRTTITTTAGSIYYLSYDLSGVSGGSPALRVDGSTEKVHTADGSYTFSFKAEGASTTIDFIGGAATFSVDNVSVKEVLFDQPNAPLTLFNHPTNIPRIEYDADGNRLGLLVEEQRTNLLTYSEDFASADSQGVTFSAAVNPTGTVNNCKVITNSGQIIPNPNQRVTRSASAAGNTGTASIFAKAGEYDSIVIEAYANNNSGRYVEAIFDLANGTVATSQGGDATWFSGFSASISEAGNGWYRCSITYTVESSTTFARIYFGPADSTATTGDGFSGVLMFGAQLEESVFPTSYIPTSGSTATRAADVASIPTSAFGYNASEGTVVVEYENTQNEKSGFIWSLEDGTSDERIYGIQRVNQAGSFAVTDNGSTQADITSGSGSLGQPLKIASAYKINDFAHYLSGSQVGTDSSGAIPSVNSLYIGLSSATPDFPRNGHIKSLTYFPRRLTNAQLQQLTE
jgi:hypothetical protein